jgi:hypothetical protein
VVFPRPVLLRKGEIRMSPDEAGLQLARECPLKILPALHAKGHYVHGTSARFPGKVLCFHKDSALPEDWTPTPAQVQAWQGAPGVQSLLPR